MLLHTLSQSPVKSTSFSPFPFSPPPSYSNSIGMAGVFTPEKNGFNWGVFGAATSLAVVDEMKESKEEKIDINKNDTIPSKEIKNEVEMIPAILENTVAQVDKLTKDQDVLPIPATKIALDTVDTTNILSHKPMSLFLSVEEEQKEYEISQEKVPVTKLSNISDIAKEVVIVISETEDKMVEKITVLDVIVENNNGSESNSNLPRSSNFHEENLLLAPALTLLQAESTSLSQLPLLLVTALESTDKEGKDRSKVSMEIIELEDDLFISSYVYSPKSPFRRSSNSFSQSTTPKSDSEVSNISISKISVCGLAVEQLQKEGYEHAGMWRGWPFDSWSCCGNGGKVCTVLADGNAKDNRKCWGRNITIERRGTISETASTTTLSSSSTKRMTTSKNKSSPTLHNKLNYRTSSSERSKPITSQNQLKPAFVSTVNNNRKKDDYKEVPPSIPHTTSSRTRSIPEPAKFIRAAIIRSDMMMKDVKSVSVARSTYRSPSTAPTKLNSQVNNDLTADNHTSTSASHNLAHTLSMNNHNYITKPLCDRNPLSQSTSAINGKVRSDHTSYSTSSLGEQRKNNLKVLA